MISSWSPIQMSLTHEHPALWSLRFHTHFFPGVLRQRLRRAKPPASPFASHVRVELVLAFAASVGILAGAARWAAEGSAIGGALVALGAAGSAALAVHSAWSVREHTPKFEAFALAPFVVCVLFGLVSALFVGREAGASAAVRTAYSGVGLAGGYVLGIGAGLWVQRLGWIAGIVSVFAVAASGGLLVLAIVLLS